MRGNGEKPETTLSVFKNQFNLLWSIKHLEGFIRFITVTACVTSEKLVEEIGSLGQHAFRQESTK